MCTSTALTLTNYSLLDVVKRNEIEHTVTVVTEQLSQGHITAIVNAFIKNSLVISNGWVYFKVKGLKTMLRTGNSGIERAHVYQGIPNVMSPSEVASINGEDYISQFDLIKLIKFRMSCTSGKSVDLYLNIVFEIYEKIINNRNIKDLNQLFIQKVQENRTKLKLIKIKEQNIKHCAFTEKVIDNVRDYEFAHLDAVAYYPLKALDVNNGVIIHKNIHLEMTNLGLNTAEDVYNYCIKNNYSIKWANE